MIVETFLTLRDVLAGSGGHLVGSAADALLLRSVSLDSRTVTRGSLFVALRGPKHDGHAFVADAFARGAAAAMVERLPAEAVLAEEKVGPPVVVVSDTLAALQALAKYWFGQQPAAMIAVVGSVGKAVTAELTAAVLRDRLGAVYASALHRPELSLPLALLRVHHGIKRLVLEVGTLEESRMTALLDLARPGAVLVTNIQRTHLEPGWSLDELAASKALMVQSVPTGGSVALNVDDRRVRGLGVAASSQPILFGVGAEADVRAVSIVGRGLQGTEFDLIVGNRRVHVRLPLLGLNSVHDALGAAAIGLADGLELREVGAGLQVSSATPRIIVATGLNGSRVIDDSYNADPESDLEALNLLASLDGRRIAVLGDMLGLEHREVEGHLKVGNRAAGVADVLLTVGERARIIAEEARRMGLRERTFEAQNPDEALDHLRRIVRPGDNVLVKGSPELDMQSIVQAIRLEG